MANRETHVLNPAWPGLVALCGRRVDDDELVSASPTCRRCARAGRTRRRDLRPPGALGLGRTRQPTEGLGRRGHLQTEALVLGVRPRGRTVPLAVKVGAILRPPRGTRSFPAISPASSCTTSGLRGTRRRASRAATVVPVGRSRASARA